MSISLLLPRFAGAAEYERFPEVEVRERAQSLVVVDDPIAPLLQSTANDGSRKELMA